MYLLFYNLVPTYTVRLIKPVVPDTGTEFMVILSPSVSSNLYRDCENSLIVSPSSVHDIPKCMYWTLAETNAKKGRENSCFIMKGVCVCVEAWLNSGNHMYHWKNFLSQQRITNNTIIIKYAKQPYKKKKNKVLQLQIRMCLGH